MFLNEDKRVKLSAWETVSGHLKRKWFLRFISGTCLVSQVSTRHDRRLSWLLRSLTPDETNEATLTLRHVPVAERRSLYSGPSRDMDPWGNVAEGSSRVVIWR